MQRVRLLPTGRFDRRQDLEDMLVDPVYLQAVLHSLEQVKVMYQAQSELSMANEAVASVYPS